MKPGFYWVRRELMPVHSRSQEYPNSNHFIEAHSFTVLGAISINKLGAFMTIKNSINELHLSSLLKFFYVFHYRVGVVVRENLPAHKLALILSMI
jgi:hypothetical protein